MFDGVSESKVKRYFMDLAGVGKLPSPKPMKNAGDPYGNQGIMYIVKKNGVTYNLRSGSKSVDQTHAKWTIEIHGILGNKVGNRVMERQKIEVKFR